MDARMARAWYGGPWYETPEGGVHPQNDPANPQAAKAVDSIRDLLAQEIRPGTRALDLGCCTGRFTFAMEQMGAAATGVDCVGFPLEHARRLAQQWGSAATFAEANFDALPFQPGSFDLALLPKIIIECSYQEFDHLLKQLACMPVPGGELCLSMADGLQRAIDRKSLPKGYDWLSGMCHYTNQAPGHPPVAVAACFWTPGFAVHIASKWFDLVKHEQAGDGTIWLVFHRRPG